MDELVEQAKIAWSAAQRALYRGDVETHIQWGFAFHKLATRIFEEYGVEIRTSGVPRF